ncbi:MAG: ComF family protein [Firmicutes bacterium]|nr:ComF family protein [Bacillota bacterium]
MNFQNTYIDCEYDFAMASMGYGLYERRLIFNLKYDGKTYIARNIADILYDSMYKELAEGRVCPLVEADYIIPVPIHKNRLKHRGFNQSEKIAKHLGRKLGIPCECDALGRLKETEAQRALSKEDRQRNLTKAFCVHPMYKNKLKNSKIIVLDDIHTTGATASACYEALSECEPKKIYYLSLLFAGNKNHLMVE